MRLLLTAIACGLITAQAQETLINLAPKATHPDDRTQVQVEALFSMAPPAGSCTRSPSSRYPPTPRPPEKHSRRR